MDKYIKAYPASKTIDEYINFASVSGIIWRSHEIFSLSSIKMHQPILDIGCGNGIFAKTVFDNKFNWGLDISRELIGKAKENDAYKNYIVADAHKIPLKNNSVQTVFSNSVFEHMRNLDGILNEIERILKPGGELVFTTHSPRSKDFFLEKLLQKIGLNKMAVLYKEVFCKMLQIRTIWTLKVWNKKLTEREFTIVESKEIISPYSAFWFEMFLPFAYFQNRISILKKLPITKLVFILLKIDYSKTHPQGRNFFIRARKKQLSQF